MFETLENRLAPCVQGTFILNGQKDVNKQIITHGVSSVKETDGAERAGNREGTDFDVMVREGLADQALLRLRTMEWGQHYRGLWQG